MAFLATRVSREMEVQMKETPLCENLFHMVNPSFSSRFNVSPWASMSAPVFPSGLSNAHRGLDLFQGNKRGREVTEMEFLFSKILTPSDVGKLNRLLIPRQSAEKYFPKISEAKSDENDPTLTFEDYSTGSVWHFRFSFWRSSNTYVLTKGWPLFVKERKLNNGNIVSFYRTTGKSIGTNRIVIHIKSRQSTVPMFTPSGLLNDEWVREGLGFSSGNRFQTAWKPLPFGSGGLMPLTLLPQPTLFIESMSLCNSIRRTEKRLRLFGVDIDVSSHVSGDDSRNEWMNNVA